MRGGEDGATIGEQRAGADEGADTGTVVHDDCHDACVLGIGRDVACVTAACDSRGRIDADDARRGRPGEAGATAGRRSGLSGRRLCGDETEGDERNELPCAHGVTRVLGWIVTGLVEARTRRTEREMEEPGTFFRAGVSVGN